MHTSTQQTLFSAQPSTLMPISGEFIGQWRWHDSQQLILTWHQGKFVLTATDCTNQPCLVQPENITGIPGRITSVADIEKARRYFSQTFLQVRRDDRGDLHVAFHGRTLGGGKNHEKEKNTTKMWRDKGKLAESSNTAEEQALVDGIVLGSDIIKPAALDMSSTLQLGANYVRYHNTVELTLAFNQAKDPQTKKDLKDVALQVIQEFTRKQTKTHDNIQELIPLAACEDAELSRQAHIAIIQPICDRLFIEENMLQGIAQMVSITPKDQIPRDDLVKMLRVVAAKMEELFDPKADSDTEQLEGLLSATASVLDAMLDKELKSLSKEERDSLYNLLQSVRDSKVLRLRYLGCYALEGLLRVPDDESKANATMRHAVFIVQGLVGLAKIVASQGASIGDIVDVVQNFKQGFTFKKRKSAWFDLIRRSVAMIDNTRNNRKVFSEVIHIIKEQGPEVKDWRFVYGVLDGLKEMAKKVTDSVIHAKLFDLMKDIYLNTSSWGKDSITYDYVLSCLIVLIKDGDAALSELAKKTLTQIELQLPEEKKAEGRVRYQRAMLEEGVKEAKEIQRLPKGPVIESRADMGLLSQARKLAFPLDYRVELMIERAEKIRKPGEALYQDLKMYVPVQGKISEHATERLEMLSATHAFVSPNEQTKKVLLIQGGAGSGKSFFLRYIETELWKSYTPGAPIPLFISLPSLEDPTRNAVEQVLSSFGCSPDEISRFQKGREFIFILDGYDEIKSNKNLYHSNQLDKWKAKVIVTSRSEYLAGRDYRNLFKADQQVAVDDLAELHIAPFEQAQIDVYLQNLAKQKESPWQDWRQYRSALNSIPGLNELVGTPFVLTIITQVLPKLEANQKQQPKALQRAITRADVYDIFTEFWFEREEQKWLSSGVAIPSEYNLKASFMAYCQDLSFRLFLRNKTAVQAQSSNYTIQKLKEDEWARFFKTKEDDIKVWLARQGAILRKTGNQVSFIHKSILEFFVAKILHQEIKESTEEMLGEMSFFNQKLLNQEPSIILFLADMVQGKYEESQILLSIVLETRRNPRLAIAAANSMTILNLTRFNFSTLDLSHIKIPFAILENALMHYTNLQHADLTGVNLKRTFLYGANLSNTNMTDVYFGEYAYLRQESGVPCMSYSPDGKILATGSSDKSVWLWDTKMSEPWGEPLRGHTDYIRSVQFSPDGKMLATGSEDNTILFWDILTQKPLGKPLRGHEDIVSCVYFSPDGTMLASGSEDKTARLWDTQTRKLIGEPLRGHTDIITSIHFSPDGKTLATGSADKTVILWDVKTRKKLREAIEGHEESVTSICFSPDGKILATVSEDKTIRLWHTQTSKSFGEPMRGHANHITSVCFSPDGKMLATGSMDDTARLWDTQTQKPLGEVLRGHKTTVTCVCFSPDGKVLATGSDDKSVRLWDTQAAGKPLGESPQGHEKSVTAIDFSPDGKILATGSDDKTVRLWDTQTQKLLGEPLRGHTSYINSVNFFPNEKILITTNDVESIQLWETQTRKQLGKIPHEQKDKTLRSANFSLDGKVLAISIDGDYSVQLWDAQTQKPLGKPLCGHEDNITSIHFSPDGKILATGSKDNSARLWHIKTGEPLGGPLQVHEDSVYSAHFSPDGKILCTASMDDTVQLWDVQTQKPLGNLLKHESGFMKSPNFSPDGKMLATSIEGDKTIRLWDTETGKPLGNPLRGHEDNIISVHFSPDGKLLVTGSEDKTIRLWNTQTTEPLGEPLLGHGSHVRSVHFSPDGKILATGSDDNTVRLWDLSLLPNSKEKTLIIKWQTPPYYLNTHQTNFFGAKGLSDNNNHLLLQRGAIESSTEQNLDVQDSSITINAATPITDKEGITLPESKIDLRNLVQQLAREQQSLFDRMRKQLQEEQDKILSHFSKQFKH